MLLRDCRADTSPSSPFLPFSEHVPAVARGCGTLAGQLTVIAAHGYTSHAVGHTLILLLLLLFGLLSCLLGLLVGLGLRLGLLLLPLLLLLLLLGLGVAGTHVGGR